MTSICKFRKNDYYNETLCLESAVFQVVHMQTVISF